MMLAVILLTVVSCVTVEDLANSITVETGEIPPDMEREDFTIIGVLKGRKSYDKWVRKGFANYTGRYVLATISEIKEKYSNVDEYRYYIDFDKEVEIDYDWEAERDVKTTRYRYHIVDRKRKKKYVRVSTTKAFARQLEGYVMAIDVARTGRPYSD